MSTLIKESTLRYDVCKSSHSCSSDKINIIY